MDSNNEVPFLLLLPPLLFKRLMDSAGMHKHDPMDEFIYRLYRSFEIVPDTPEAAEEIERLLQRLKATKGKNQVT
jgi:hypothetical protein